MEWLTIKGSDDVFVVFHGTGGNDADLLFLTGEINAKARVYSFLGNVNSGVNRRFFAPLLPNQQVDRVDLEMRVHDFLTLWDSEFAPKLMNKNVTFVGYSNGANFIMALLEKRPDIATQTLLFHPSNLGWKFNALPKTNKILAVLGANDMMAPPGSMVQLRKQWHEQGNEQLDIHMSDGTHAIIDSEVNYAKQWYNRQITL